MARSGCRCRRVRVRADAGWAGAAWPSGGAGLHFGGDFAEESLPGVAGLGGKGGFESVGEAPEEGAGEGVVVGGLDTEGGMAGAKFAQLGAESLGLVEGGEDGVEHGHEFLALGGQVPGEEAAEAGLDVEEASVEEKSEGDGGFADGGEGVTDEDLLARGQCAGSWRVSRAWARALRRWASSGRCWLAAALAARRAVAAAVCHHWRARLGEPARNDSLPRRSSMTARWKRLLRLSG